MSFAMWLHLDTLTQATTGGGAPPSPCYTASGPAAGACLCSMSGSQPCTAPALTGGGQCSLSDPCLARDQASCNPNPSDPAAITGCRWEGAEYFRNWCGQLDQCPTDEPPPPPPPRNRQQYLSDFYDGGENDEIRLYFIKGGLRLVVWPEDKAPLCRAGSRGGGGYCNCAGAIGWVAGEWMVNPNGGEGWCHEGKCYTGQPYAACNGTGDAFGGSLGDGTWCYNSRRETL